MPNIKLRDGSGVEQTYTGVDTITVPLADGTGTWTYGLTDEELTFTNASYMFSIYSPFYNNSNYYIRRSNFNNVSDMSFMFKNNDKITDLSDITINISGDDVRIINAFEDCINLRKIPTFTMSSGSKININQSASFLRNCYVLEEGELQKVIYLETYSSPQSSLFAYNYNIKNIDLSDMKLNTWDNRYWSYNKFVNSEPNLRSLKLPAWNVKQDSKPLTSSSYYLSDSFSEMIMLDSLTFSTNADGSPMKAKVKGQSFYVTGSNSYPYGYLPNNMDTYTSSKGLMSYPDEPITKDDNVFRDINSSNVTVEKIQEGYNRVKNRPNWCSFWSGNITYNGTSVTASRLTSRFNHNSIVEFINTLPDTSEYLATAGGTNTLKLLKYQGDLTDEGGVSNLTPEEIAVATAKGWTVSIVV